MESLKLCRCGREVQVVRDKNPRLQRPSRNGWHIQCNSCNLLFGYDKDYAGEYTTPEQAIAAWNNGESEIDNLKKTEKNNKPELIISLQKIAISKGVDLSWLDVGVKFWWREYKYRITANGYMELMPIDRWTELCSANIVFEMLKCTDEIKPVH